MKNKHAIICGTNKSGTTSLFRYLGDHPEVILSSRKEAGFFFQDVCSDEDAYYDKYLQLFPGSNSNESFLLEATPTYLDAGSIVAQRIKKLLASPKLIFVLREPTARLQSYFRSKHGMETASVANVDFEQFVEHALKQAVAQPAEKIGKGDFGWQLIKSQYGRFLKQYLRVFEASDICVLFFDDLLSNPAEVTKQVCTFLDIDSDFFSDYVFSIENKSRVHRSSMIRTLASRVNTFSEPLLNRAPAIRRGLRHGYNLINVEKSAAFASKPELTAALKEYFKPYNWETREVLTGKLGLRTLPEWLAEE